MRIDPYLFYIAIERFTSQFKTTEKNDSHCSCFQENYDLPLWRGPAVKKKPQFSNERALITRKIMRSTASRDAQWNTGE